MGNFQNNKEDNYNKDNKKEDNPSFVFLFI